MKSTRKFLGETRSTKNRAENNSEGVLRPEKAGSMMLEALFSLRIRFVRLLNFGSLFLDDCPLSLSPASPTKKIALLKGISIGANRIVF